MTDPLSMTASIVGIAAAAGQLAMTLYRTYNDIQDAPKEAQNLRIGLKTLIDALRGIKNLSGRDTTGRLSKDLLKGFEAAVGSCMDTLDSLHKLTQQFKQPESRLINFEKARWKLKEGEVRKLTQRIETDKTTIIVFLTQVNM